MSKNTQSRRPYSFELIDGACLKTPAEILLALDRVVAFPRHTFTILNVNELSANDQEIVVEFIAKHSRSAHELHLHCIQSKDTVLHGSPGVEIRIWNETLLNTVPPGTWLQSITHSGGNVEKVRLVKVVSESSGSGKTRYIRSKMKELELESDTKSAALYIHEDFSISKAVRYLTTQFEDCPSQNRAIHFGISCNALTPTENVSSSSTSLLLSINNFFNSILILNSVYDPSSGTTFHTGSVDIFVELESSAKTGDSGQKWLEQFIPILSFCGDVQQPPSDFIIDDQSRRVAIYLRAYDDGSIDKQFNSTQRNKRIMFVLDKSESMEIDLGGRTALEVATDSMLGIFDSHLELMDVSFLFGFFHLLLVQNLSTM